MAEPIVIDDPDDPRVAPYVAIRERDLVGRDRGFIAEGGVVLRLVLSGRSRHGLRSVFLAEELWPRWRDALAALPEGIPVYVAPRVLMSAVSGFPIHRGMLAHGLRRPDEALADLLPAAKESCLVLGLLGLTNHDNVGGLFRNAAAFGVDAVALDAGSCDPLYRKAIRVSSGAALSVPFARGGDAQAMLAALAQADVTPVALSPGGAEDLGDFSPPPRLALLVGTEGEGLPDELLARLRTVRIAMSAGFDSLNVATAAAIALHHVAGRRPAPEGRAERADAGYGGGHHTGEEGSA